MKTIIKVILILTAAICAAVPMHAAAADIPAPETQATDTENDGDSSVQEGLRLGAAGLMSSFYVLCTAGNKCIYVTSRTTGPKIAAKIGVINIQVQRSSNGTSGWTTYQTVSDQLASDASYHYLDSYRVSVQGGFYYRVVLTHYAKEKGWFFPKTQSATQTSVVVYVE